MKVASALGRCNAPKALGYLSPVVAYMAGEVPPHPATERSRERLETIADAVGVNLFRCDRCQSEMVVRATQVSEDPCRDDIRLKCAHSCLWWTRHGVPLARSEYEDEIEQRRAEGVSAPVGLVDSVSEPRPSADEDALERLEALGYRER